MHHRHGSSRSPGVETANRQASLGFCPVDLAGTRLEQLHGRQLLAEPTVHGCAHDLEAADGFGQNLALWQAEEACFIGQGDLP
jgi:hypothetical protein